MPLNLYESENLILFRFSTDKAPSYHSKCVLIWEDFQIWTISLSWNARELLTEYVQKITSLQRRGHKLEDYINTYFREEIVEGLNRLNWLTFEEYFCEYKTNIAFLVDVSDNEASDPFRTPATTYQFKGHHIEQVQRLPWTWMGYFKAEINFDLYSAFSIRLPQTSVEI